MQYLVTASENEYFSTFSIKLEVMREVFSGICP